MKQIQRTNLINWKVFCLLAASSLLVSGIDAAPQKAVAKNKEKSHHEFASLISPPEAKLETNALPEPEMSYDLVRPSSPGLSR